MKKIIFFILLVLSFASLIEGIKNALFTKTGSLDFQWDSSRVLLLHADPYTRQPIDVITKVEMEIGDTITPNQPPSCLMILWPFALLPWFFAKIVWCITNLILSIYIAKRIVERLLTENETFIIVIALMVASTPWRNSIDNGQQTIMCIGFFLFAYLAAASGSFYKAGIYFSIALFKYTIALPLGIIFLFRKQKKVLIISIAIHIILTFFMGAWVRENSLDLFVKSVNFAKRHVYLGTTDVFAITKSLTSSLLLPLSVNLLLFFIGCLGVYKNYKSDIYILSVMSFFSLLSVYHLGYDYLILLFPAIYLSRIRHWYWNHFLLFSTIFYLCFVSRTIQIVLTWFDLNFFCKETENLIGFSCLIIGFLTLTLFSNSHSDRIEKGNVLNTSS